ncbi:MAG: hypothetical protein H6713_36360 [Myxococcales bacterium]|nr:hypothetical protein [Myxococcales bacterium]
MQRFQAEVTKNQGRRFELLQQRVEAENRINFLVGRFPSASRGTPRSSWTRSRRR